MVMLLLVETQLELLQICMTNSGTMWGFVDVVKDDTLGQ